MLRRLPSMFNVQVSWDIQVNVIVLLRRWKGAFISLYKFITQVLLSQCSSTWKMVLKRLFFRDSGKVSVDPLFDLLGDRAWTSYNNFNQKVVFERAFIRDRGESPRWQSQLSQWSFTRKMVLKKPFISDTGKSCAHSFRYPRRQSICWKMQLFESVELYSEDGLEKVIHQWH